MLRHETSFRAIIRKLHASVAAPASYQLTEALFLRLLGLTYLAAFASLWPQIIGLVGSHGIAPAASLMEAIRNSYGARAFTLLPSLFWIHRSDGLLIGLCVAGCVTAILLVGGIIQRFSAIACFVLYLSLVSVGQPFMGFQWDALLLESGFLAVFAGAPWLVWAYRFLLFRLIFESGFVKLASHDPNWRNFHALRFHFMTQPLPTPIAYYAHRLATPLLDFSTGAVLTIELAAPLLLFGPRRVRQTGGWILILLQVLILLSGNYAFFNFLTIALCLWAFDDRRFQPLARLLSWRVPRWNWRHPQMWKKVGNLAVLLLLVLAVFQVSEMVFPDLGTILSRRLSVLESFEIVNSYGLFAVMTTTRPEIVIEGSDDNSNWREYSFPFKPGNTHRGLPWVAPYQPRLDWQMWFAALGSYESGTWVEGLMYRLLTGERSVLGLLDSSPFERPPRYMRATLYEYEFTTLAERSRTGAIWNRQLKGVWFGPVSLARNN